MVLYMMKIKEDYLVIRACLERKKAYLEMIPMDYLTKAREVVEFSAIISMEGFSIKISPKIIAILTMQKKKMKKKQ